MLFWLTSFTYLIFKYENEREFDLKQTKKIDSKRYSWHKKSRNCSHLYRPSRIMQNISKQHLLSTCIEHALFKTGYDLNLGS